MAAGTTQLVAGLIASFVLGAAAAVALDLQPGDGSSASPSPSAEPSSFSTSPGPDEAASPPAGHEPLEPIEFDSDSPPDLSHQPPFDLQDGKRPSLEEAKRFANKYSRFIAKGNEGLEKLRAEGYLKGQGTHEEPYLLEKFYVTGELSITSANRSLIVREGYVGGQFKLNYVGTDVYVHHVYANDLRINENVKRSGPNTGGLFHDNQFAFVGQIRHFVGEFRNNEVGPRPGNAIAEYLGDTGTVRVQPQVVFNFDGFHGADVHHNRFLGQVDIKLHGHNHGDCFVCPVHDHTDQLEFPGHEHDHALPENPYGFESRHSIRYASLLFRDNEIRVDGGLALRYNDRNHDGDDRTANSEPNERLNDPHLHYQDVTIRDNKLVGGSLLIDVFNAADDHHPTQNHGILRLWDNEVRPEYRQPGPTQTRAMVLYGIRVVSADGLEFRAERNRISFLEAPNDAPGSSVTGALAPKTELRGFGLETVDASNLTIAHNLVDMGKYGLWALRLTDSTFWRLRGNDFRTEQDWRGQDVANAPEEDP